MSDRSFPPGKPYVYAFSSGRLVLLVCVVLALMAFSLMLGIRIERYQGESSGVADRDVAFPPPVKLPSEPVKETAEADTAATPAEAPSKVDLAAPATAAPESATTAAAKPLPQPEPTTSAKLSEEAKGSAATRVVPKQETTTSQIQKPIASSGKPESKATPSGQAVAASAAAPGSAKPNATQPAQSSKPAAEVAAQKASPKKPEPTLAASPTQKEIPKGHFAVQVSSSQDKSTAVFQLEQLKKKGFTTYIEEVDVPGKGRFYRVLIGPFPTEAEANSAREEILKDSSFAGCYVRSVP